MSVVDDVTGQAVTGTVAGASNQVTFTPAAPLTPGHLYE